MLNDHIIAIVKSTAPILTKQAEKLTYHFYQRMFSHHAEVIPLFNPANQETGSQQQALAAAICAYAANLDNLSVLGDAVERISQKHASLQIKPEHYPIVGEHLIASIKEILGDSASSEIINAWTQAYSFLSHILINKENQIYYEQLSQEGGWNGFRDFRVTQKEIESEIITSFYLEPTNGEPIPQYKPGQYITIRVPNASGQDTMRHYSLSDKYHPKYMRISVKRELGSKPFIRKGYVSHYLHDHIHTNAILQVAPPCGDFFLNVTENYKRPLVLLSAGVGITPIMSILLSAIETMPKREIIFIHGSLHERVHAFKKTIDHLALQHPQLKIHYRYSDVTEKAFKPQNNVSRGYIDAALIESMVPERDADYYFCGPKPFMLGIYHELLAWAIPATQIHFEFFGPTQALEAVKEKTISSQQHSLATLS